MTLGLEESLKDKPKKSCRDTHGGLGEDTAFDSEQGEGIAGAGEIWKVVSILDEGV